MDGPGSARSGSCKSFNIDAGAQRLPLFSAKDAIKVFAKKPEKCDQVVPPVKNHHCFVEFQPQNDPPYVPKVEQCYHQINWPEAVLQRWATKKANRKKNLNLVFNPRTNREPEAKKGKHQKGT